MTKPRASGSSLRLLFVASILASAFLIFLVQPMVGKRILPWFGGSPSVWTLCLAFYQTTLFLGYAYAHLLVRFAAPAIQYAIHAVMVVSALLVLPVLPGETWKPMGASSPNSDIFLMLVSSVALPFMVLASTGPLVQAWFARRFPGQSPYPLYAVSNAGSFAALLAYPFFVEPRVTLSHTSELWSLAFAATAAGVLGCGLAAGLKSASISPDETATAAEQETPVRTINAVMWLLLSACAVILLMGVTNSVTRDIASVPFLWIMPLATYLLTFILCFASERTYQRVPYVLVTVIGFFLTIGVPLLEQLGLDDYLPRLESIYVHISGYCMLLFGSCMVMHGELYRLRPHANALTAFYLCVSGGGAIGGLLVGLVAPIVFDGFYEVRVGLGVSMVLLTCAAALEPRSRAHSRSRMLKISAPVACTAIVVLLWPSSATENQILHQVRGFFGVLRVSDTRGSETPQRHLSSGSTLHGIEFLVPGGGRMPSAYFGTVSGIGLALGQRETAGPMHVGIVGLGAGTLSAYGEEGDRFRFYEIDPEVVSIARDMGLFSFVSSSYAEVSIVLGDARLMIADEQSRGGSQAYDVLVVDAFSSDAIPVHLLTLEAFRHYTDAIVDDGVLAIHVSNRHLDLAPVVARIGFEVGLKTLYVHTRSSPPNQSRRAQWVMMSRSAERLGKLARKMRSTIEAKGLPPQHLEIYVLTRPDVSHIPLWTDDYSDLFGALKP